MQRRSVLTACHPQGELGKDGDVLSLSLSFGNSLLKYIFHPQPVWLIITPAVWLSSPSIQSSRLKTWRSVNKYCL